MNGIVPVAPQSYEEITGEGIVGVVNGHEVRIGSGKFTGGPAEPGVHIAFDGVHRGYFEVKSRYRSGLAEVLAWFKTEGDIWLLSGDHNQEANALSSFFEENESMRFNQSPQDKLEFIQQMQRHGRKVMMLGDGLNDAGALQQSNLGVVIAENTNNFTPACDAILHAEEFEKLPAYMKLARSGVRIVNRAYYIAFIYNVIGLSFAVTGTLSPLIAAILMPLSSVTIVLFGVLSGNLMAYRHKIS
jgi:Cu+-exporting ATPase